MLVRMNTPLKGPKVSDFVDSVVEFPSNKPTPIITNMLFGIKCNYVKIEIKATNDEEEISKYTLHLSHISNP